MTDEIELKVGDKILITEPDWVSQENKVQKGHVGKVSQVSLDGCNAKNPLWDDGWMTFCTSEFEVLKEESE